MNILLDTNVFLWSATGKHISEKAIQAIENSDICYLSVVSLFEIAIKRSVGKLHIEDTIFNVAETSSNRILHITTPHLETMSNLPFTEHKDPFDRMIIAQAMTENLTVITSDKHFKNYKCKTIIV